jgi:hypothetical protein
MFTCLVSRIGCELRRAEANEPTFSRIFLATITQPLTINHQPSTHVRKQRKKKTVEALKRPVKPAFPIRSA